MKEDGRNDAGRFLQVIHHPTATLNNIIKQTREILK
jgi:hypothetical protein